MTTMLVHPRTNDGGNDKRKQRPMFVLLERRPAKLSHELCHERQQLNTKEFSTHTGSRLGQEVPETNPLSRR